MAPADERIRVSERVKRSLDRRKREGESYNDVLVRLLEPEEADILAGFGRWSDEHADRVRDTRERDERGAKAGMRRLADDE